MLSSSSYSSSTASSKHNSFVAADGRNSCTDECTFYNDWSQQQQEQQQRQQQLQQHRLQRTKQSVPVSIFLVFISCVAMCTSEALIPSSTPTYRFLQPLRGGDSTTTPSSSSSKSPTTTTAGYDAASTKTPLFGFRHNNQRGGAQSSAAKTSPLSLYAGDVSDDTPTDFVNGSGKGSANGAGSAGGNSKGSASDQLKKKQTPPQKVRLSRMPLNGVAAPRAASASASTTTATGVSVTKHGQRERSSSSSTDGNHPNAVNGFHLDSEAGEAWVDRPIPAEFVAETNLPTEVGQFRLRAYRSRQSDTNEYVGREPSVIYATGNPPFGADGRLKQDVPIRIHDQCITSEVFGSQRCDCSQQLNMALKYVSEHGGCVIYLQQEGRGIGLANKVAAYSLQDVGLDTVDANLHLGFPEDARQYGVIPSILDDMQIGSVQLMTNNPRKVDRLRALGVQVDNTIPMVVPETNPHNYRYMEVKHDRMNHTNLSPLLAEERQGKAFFTKKMPSLAQTYISEGEEMAANAVQVSLNVIDEDGLTAMVDDDESQEGVTARGDGYCFGRKSVEDAVDAVREGKMVVVVDDMDRENEGDLIMAADACTPEDMAKIVRYSSGVICIAMDGERMDELGLPPMLQNNEDPKGTAFTVTVDATKEHGITTGISATDRAKTVNLLANPNAKVTDFARPGHIFPLRAREGGVLTRDGHTEAAVDLSALAGRHRSGILCEIVSEENPTEMARLPELKRFCREHGFVLTSIVDIAQYRRDTEGSNDETMGI
mmetsp:Transcript_13301/g.32474  ORF Transcript_13301/g.32474 Transcript_13301/m.32474 type:complete len:769 (+) Transcript_13301:433-2739(+)